MVDTRPILLVPSVSMLCLGACSSGVVRCNGYGSVCCRSPRRIVW